VAQTAGDWLWGKALPLWFATWGNSVAVPVLYFMVCTFNYLICMDLFVVARILHYWSV